MPDVQITAITCCLTNLVPEMTTRPQQLLVTPLPETGASVAVRESVQLATYDPVLRMVVVTVTLERIIQQQQLQQQRQQHIVLAPGTVIGRGLLRRQLPELPCSKS